MYSGKTSILIFNIHWYMFRRRIGQIKNILYILFFKCKSMILNSSSQQTLLMRVEGTKPWQIKYERVSPYKVLVLSLIRLNGSSALANLCHCKTSYSFHKAMMPSSNGNIFRDTGHLCGEFTGHRWIPLTKANEAELWCFLWSAPEWKVE